MEKKTQTVKMSVVPNLINRSDAILIKKLCCGYWQTESKVCSERQKSQNTQHNIEGQNKVEILIVPDFKAYYKAIVIKTV